MKWTTQEEAKKILEDNYKDEIHKKYWELIFQVCRCFPNETRHETALRYIREAENLPNSTPCEEMPK